MNKEVNLKEWVKSRVKPYEIEKYMDKDESGRLAPFINTEEIEKNLKETAAPSKEEVKDIIAKSLSIKSLTQNEIAKLLNIEDAEMWREVFDAAIKVKKKVYDNRIVTFAPLYTGNYCVNNCLYCGFRCENKSAQRRMLSLDEVRSEAEHLAGKIGHKRLITVYGEHPKTGINYIIDTLKAIYDTKVTLPNGRTVSIRRINVNAAPLQVDELKELKKAGIGTYQVFQETYHKETYEKVHPQNTLKGNYLWRLYSMHRAMEAGIDDVGLGALFGLYDWKFEVMALAAHSVELEKKFGIGGHTISFPRLEPADGAPLTQNSKYKVSDDNFLKIIAVLRLAVPYTGMIITARETPEIRKKSVYLGVTQTDASTRIGIGAYSDRYDTQESKRQQFILGDTRSLDEVIKEFARMGFITSFCTAGYRCGRTGDKIMGLLRSGKEGHFCKLNAVLTFKEYLDDFASPETKEIGEALIKKEFDEVKEKLPDMHSNLLKFYEKITQGKRDLYF